MSVSEVQQYRQLTYENARLKKLVAERDLEIESMKELLKKNGKCISPPPVHPVFTEYEAFGAPRLHACWNEPIQFCLSTAAEE